MIKNKEYLIISFSRYFNLIIEYFILVITSRFFDLSTRGDFVIITSIILFSSAISSLSLEQFGAKKYYLNEFNFLNYFNVMVLITILVALLVSLFVFFNFNYSFLVILSIFFGIISITIFKQSIVIYQSNGNISDYSYMFIVQKIVLGITIWYGTYGNNLEETIFLYMFTYLIFAIKVLYRNISFKGININTFKIDFLNVKFLYLTFFLTSVYSFVDMFIVYTKINKETLALYQLAIQFNAAVAVLGQSYNVFIFSSKTASDPYQIIKNYTKINMIILMLSTIFILIVHSPIFTPTVVFVFGNNYESLYDIVKYTIFILPASLIAMFYAPLWILKENYKELFYISIFMVLTFTTFSMILLYIYNHVLSIIVSLYLTSVIGVYFNLKQYKTLKKEFANEKS